MIGVFTIYDKVAKAHTNPFYMREIDEARRAFGDECRKPSDRNGNPNQYHEHPADFELYFLGTYDPAVAKIETLPSPEMIAKGTDFRSV